MAADGETLGSLAGLLRLTEVSSVPVLAFDDVHEPVWPERAAPARLAAGAAVGIAVPFGSAADGASIASQVAAEVSDADAWAHVHDGGPWTWSRSKPGSHLGYALKSDGSGDRLAACRQWVRDVAPAALAAAAALKAAAEGGDEREAAALAERALPAVLVLEALLLRATPVSGGDATDAACALMESVGRALELSSSGNTGAPATPDHGGAAPAAGASPPFDGTAPSPATAAAPATGRGDFARAAALAARRFAAQALLASLRQPAARLGRTSALLPHLVAHASGPAAAEACLSDPDAAPVVLLDALALLTRVADSHRPWLRLLAAGSVLRLARRCPRALRHHRATAFELLASVRSATEPHVRLVAARAAQAVTAACYGPPPSAGHDEELDRCLREALTASSLDLQRASALAVAGSLAGGGCHSARVLGDVLRLLCGWACDSPDAAVVVASLAGCRAAAVSCWPRVRDHDETAASLVAAAVTAAAQSGAVQGLSGRAKPGSASGAAPAGALGPASRAVVEESLLLLAAVARAAGPGATAAMVSSALGHEAAAAATGAGASVQVQWVASAVGLAPSPSA